MARGTARRPAPRPLAATAEGSPARASGTSIPHGHSLGQMLPRGWCQAARAERVESTHDAAAPRCCSRRLRCLPTPWCPPPPAFAPAPPCCGTAGGPGGRRLRQRLRCCPGPAWPRRQPWTRRLLVGCRGGTPARSALPSTPDLCVRLLEKCLILPSPVAGGCPGKDRSGRGVGGAGETPRCHHLPGTLPASTSPKACACDGRHRSRSKQ